MLRIATRRSALARAQAFQVGKLLTERTGSPFELVPLTTTGDRAPERAVTEFDTKGLFVDSIRAAVLSGDADLAVHSAKDLPGETVDGLVIGAYPLRADPRDLLVTREGFALATLPGAATVGTSSARRAVQLLRTKPGLSVLPIRGNVDTRLGKVADGEFDAVVLAAAGLSRLYVDERDGGLGPLTLPLKAYALEPGECVPAPAQGALAVECREDDADALAACRSIDDRPTRQRVVAERAFSQRLGGGCLAAVGALCSLTGQGQLELIGMLGDVGRRRMLRLSSRGDYRSPEALGQGLADEMREAFR